MAKTNKPDEESDDKFLDRLAFVAGGNRCPEWITSSKGKRVRCTRKPHRFGKHKT